MSVTLSPEEELLAIQAELNRRGVTLDSSSVQVLTNPVASGRDYSPYRHRPKDFFTDILEAYPWSKQVEVMEAVDKDPRVSVRSCHGVGKTFVSAGIGIWFLLSRKNSIVITTAPTARQVVELLWREIRGHHARANLPGKCLTAKWEIDDQWFAMGLSTDDPNKFQGFHADSGDILMIVDEAAGVSAEVFDAGDGILTSEGAKQLLIGNPTTTSGKFHATHHELRDYWHPIHISAFDSPNVTGEWVPPGVSRSLITPGWIEARKREWGEESPLYASRVLGEFPDQAENTLIALSWLDFASFNFTKIKLEQRGSMTILESYKEIDGSWRSNLWLEPTVLGGDVARYGGAESGYYIRRGPVILAYEFWRGADLMETTGRFAAAGKAWGVQEWNIDGTGYGASVVDRLRETGIPANGVTVGERARDSERFCMLRDEIAWGLRMRLQERAIGPLKDKKTQSQCSAIKYTYDSRGRIKVESKEEMTKRQLPSPDRFDALCLAFMPSTYNISVPLGGGTRPRALTAYKVR